MPVVPEDFKMGVTQFLSGVNAATNLGATDSTWSGNATITAVCTAILALPQVAGGSPDMQRKASDSLHNGVLSGAVSETHGVTTAAGARALATAVMPELPSTYMGNLLQ